jgi:hypothetical protein
LEGRVRLLAEVVLVFLGIVAAFSLESWRTDRAEEERELAVLEGVVPEFAAAETEATALRTVHEHSRDAFIELHRLLRTGEGELYPDSTLNLTIRLWTVGPLDLEMPVYENLLSTTGFGVVRNDSLRLALRTYELAAGANRDWDDFLRAYDQNLMTATLGSRLPAFAWIMGDPDFGGPLRPEIATLASDMEFRNLIAIRTNGETQLIRLRTEVVGAIREVRRLLDAELSERR